MTATFDRPLPVAIPAARSTRSSWLGFSAVLGAALMNLLDSTVVSVAAPVIRDELGGTNANLQWTTAGYTLALAVLLMVGGRLGDMVGRRRMLLIGTVGFTAASMLCALAWSPEVLVGGRVVQGAFAALMLPQGFGLIRDAFPPADMAKPLAAFGPVMGIGAVLGPIVGGFLVDANLFGTGWRMIFLINLPLGILTVLLAVKHLPKVAPTAAGARLDWISVALSAAGTVLLILPLVQGHELHWPAWTIVSLVASVPVFAIFARRQSRLARAGRTPLVEPSLAGKRSYVAGVGFATIFFAAMGAMFTVGMMLQIGLGYSAIGASVMMAPWAFGALVGSGVSGMLMAKLGRTLLHVGLALMGAGRARPGRGLPGGGRRARVRRDGAAAAGRWHRHGDDLRANVRHRARRGGRTARSVPRRARSPRSSSWAPRWASRSWARCSSASSALRPLRVRRSTPAA
jgi:MFS family permease